MLENESQEYVHVKRMTVLSCIRHRLAVNSCAGALKSLSTAAELTEAQFNFMKAFAATE